MSDTADLQSSLTLFSLKDNAQFLVANAVGDCVGTSEGLFRDDTRVLSRFALLLGDRAPSLLSSGLSQDNVYFRAHLTNPAKAVYQTFDGYGRKYAWTNIHGLVSHARLADPDSDRKFGQQFLIDSLSADEFEPTFKFRNVSGDVRKLGDSVWFKISHFDMPASTGNGSGKVWWGGGVEKSVAAPPRLAIVEADGPV